MADWIGKTLSKVRIEKLIARGGMAEVYYGLHTTLDRPVAVKVLLSFLEDSPDLKIRFEREARVLASLRHPNIVQIYDFDLADGQPYFVMEYLGGPTLADHLRDVHNSKGRMSLPQIGRILVMLASALDYAHANGVIHRDIKPGNMILNSKTTSLLPGMVLPEDTEIILTDFGLLRLTDASSHSVSGTISGTPAYMSPEQARGDKVDHRSDLYSLGVALYEMLARRVPFESESSMGILMKHISEAPAHIPELPIALQNVLDRALSKKPADRYNSARELARAFLEAANLNEAEVAPGYRLTPTPGTLSDVTLPPDNRATTLSLPKPISRQRQLLLWLIAIPVILILAVAGFYRFAPISQPLVAKPPTSTLEPTAALQAPVEPSMPGMSEATSEQLVSHGLLRFFDVSGILNEVILTTDGLPPAPTGSQYEAWLVGGESRRSLGAFSPDTSGKAELTFLDEQGRNLLVRYDRLEITLEDNPDQSPNPSGKVVFSSGVPPLALSHIRHLLVAFGDTPNRTGLLVGLVTGVDLLNTQAAALVEAYDKKDAAEVRKNTEALYNLLVGSQGKDYGDLDGNGSVTDPGDSYGLFLNGEHAGYIEGTLQHAKLAMEMPDASTNVEVHGEHVLICGKNIEDWATQVLTLTTQILADPLSAESGKSVREIASLADRMQNGRDLNGNEKIEPVPGEGGAKTALQHAGYMTDMPIFEGAEKLPPPVNEPGTGTPVAIPTEHYEN